MELLTQTQSYYHTFDNARVYFEETPWGGITPTAPNEEAKPNTRPSPTFQGLIRTYESEAQKIRAKYGASLETLEDLDFSNLGLTQLPPHILLECKKARRLDLSGNNIHFLPCQLQMLHLVSLDISDNERLQPNIPSWLGGLPGLILTANDMGLDFVPEGFTLDRLISNDLPKGMEHAYGQTQLPVSTDIY